MNYSLKKGGDSMATADEIRRGVARGIGRPSPGLERLTKLLPEWIAAGKPLIVGRLVIAADCPESTVRRYLARNDLVPIVLRQKPKRRKPGSRQAAVASAEHEADRKVSDDKPKHDAAIALIAAEKLAAMRDSPRRRRDLAAMVREARRRERRRPRWGEALAEILERDPDLPAELAAVAEARAAGKVRRDRLYIRAEAVAAFWRERGGAA